MTSGPPQPGLRPASEPRKDEIAAARALLAEIEDRVFATNGAVNAAGDAPTTASIVGGLLGHAD
jgi:hypothetical protein